MTGRYNKLMQCHVTSYAYDYIYRIGSISFAKGECCDMGGCIEFYTRIDKNVNYIRTFSGDEPDTSYIKVRGEWEARKKSTL